MKNEVQSAVAVLGLAATLGLVLTLWPESRDTPGPFFVTPNGNASSQCSQEAPCTLTRAVALVNNTTIDDCAVINLARGDYSQAALTISGSGRENCDIRFVGNGEANITGARLQIPPENWSLRAGAKYTYQAAHNQATFNSSNPFQKNPTNWQPIIVKENPTADREFVLDFPPRYRNADSLAAVEAQSCSHLDDATTVYVHMCNDQAPSTASDLWLSSTGWGTVTITGRYVTFDGINLQHSAKSGQNGFHLGSSSQNIILRNFDFRATGITAQGSNTVIQDGRVGYVIMQGPPGGKQCYDANPAFGVGECWNAQGLGSAFDVGIDRSQASSGVIVQRVEVHRGWNGVSLRGPNAIVDSLFHSFANHTSSIAGTGGIYQRNVALNGQDSLYLEGADFDQILVEHNLFYNGTLFWVSRDGKGGTPPTGWQFRYNIAPSIVFDDKTFPTVRSDCNIWLESPADPNMDIFRITPTEAGGFRGSWNTLAEWQAATPQDDHSVELAYTNWTNGTQFERFTKQAQRFDFHAVRDTAAAWRLSGCGHVAGPYGHGR